VDESASRSPRLPRYGRQRQTVRTKADRVHPRRCRRLDEHADDRRPHEYSFDEFRDGLTHDDLWNAAQRQLLHEGIIHNYLRMLWGKKILEWTPDWQTALETMIELNNDYAVDGCDPNSYSGIFWVLGRYDRAWGPERPVFGKIRYMTSANTARKVRVRNYIKKHLGT
jgi:deoxyribodipyrimidine photo-lyase